jgi:hypothetical protein
VTKVNTSQSFQYLDVKIDKLYADINILFQIVSDAQQSPHPPVKALFAAYDKVLAEHGIAHQHDQRFFRYVLRLGEGASHNTRSLMVRLRKLLAKLDIHIVVQDDPNAAEDEEDDLAQDNVRPTKELGQSSATRGRRASFNDTRLDETWLSGGRLDPARSGNSWMACRAEDHQPTRRMPITESRREVESLPNIHRSRLEATLCRHKAVSGPLDHPHPSPGLVNSLFSTIRTV